MKFNGKSIIVIGFIMFILQLVNFISINTITPELERAQVLSALTSIIVILIGLLFERFNPITGDKVQLLGENSFVFDKDLPVDLLDELAWGSEAILTSTAAASILIHCDGLTILRRGIISKKKFNPGKICLGSIKDMKLISLANTKFYPGKSEFDNFCENVPSVLIVPVDNKTFILLGGWSPKCFTKSDEKWINNWSKKINDIFLKNDL